MRTAGAQDDKARASVRAVIEAAMAEVAATLGHDTPSLVWDAAPVGGPGLAGSRSVTTSRVAAVLNLLQGLMQVLAPLMQMFCAGAPRHRVAGRRWMDGGIASTDALLPVWIRTPVLPRMQYAPQWEQQGHAPLQLGLQAIGAGLLVLANEFINHRGAGPPLQPRAPAGAHAFRRFPVQPPRPDG